jgi:hypothetical protein
MKINNIFIYGFKEFARRQTNGTVRMNKNSPLNQCYICSIGADGVHLGCSQIILLKDYDTLLIQTSMENYRATISLIKIIICGPTAGL